MCQCENCCKNCPNKDKLTIHVVTLVQTCGACPSQWEGRTIDDKSVYIRYRWGCLSVYIDDECVYSERVGDGMDGVMDMEELQNYINIEW